MVWPFNAQIRWGTFLHRLRQDGVEILNDSLSIEVDGRTFSGGTMRRVIPGGQTLEIPHPYNFVAHPDSDARVDPAVLQYVIHTLQLDPDRYTLLP